MKTYQNSIQAFKGRKFYYLKQYVENRRILCYRKYARHRINTTCCQEFAQSKSTDPTEAESRVMDTEAR